MISQPNAGILHALRTWESEDERLIEEVEKKLEGLPMQEQIAASLRASLSGMVGTGNSADFRKRTKDLIEDLLPDLLPAYIKVTGVEQDPSDPALYNIKMEMPSMTCIIQELKL